MAVIYEDVKDGLVKSHSDSGFYIHGGSPENDYAEAIDPKNLNRKYTETSTKIPQREATIEDYQAKLRELGVQI